MDQTTTATISAQTPAGAPGAKASVERAAAAVETLRQARAKAAPASAAEPAPKAPPAQPAPVGDPDDDGPTWDTSAPRQAERASVFDDPPATSGDPAPADEPEERVSAVVRAREKANRIRREAEAERQRLEMQRAELDRERRELERYAKAAKAQSPAEALRAMGLDPRAVLEDTALEGTPEHTIRQLQARLEQQERALQEYQRSQQEALDRRHRAEAEQTFQTVAQNEERFPYLAARAATHPELVKRQAYELQSAYFAKTGQYPTLEMIAEGLDAIEEQGYRAITERQARRGTSTAAPTGRDPAADKSPRKPTKTLSSQRSGERSVAEPDPRTLTRDQRARIAAEKLRRYRAALGK